MRARSALFTLFGDVVRPAGGQVWLTTLTACMEALGFTAEATRTALHRMAGEGWVEPRRDGRYASYRLTPRGEDRLEEAAARIYRLRAAEWDGRWRLLVGPQATRRTSLARALRWMGFGQLSADTWVSPHPHGPRLSVVLAEHGREDALTFVTEVADAEAARDRRIVETAWDLDALETAQADFVERWSHVPAPAGDADAFARRIALVHDWRSFLHLDPGLPASLLPAGWLGDAAADCFRDRYEEVERPAWRFYDRLLADAPSAAGRTDDGSTPHGPGGNGRRPSPLEHLTGLQARTTSARA